MRAPRFPLADAVRALAALAILAYHVAFLTGGLGSAWLAGLNVGVPLFFALSGFLLYRPWIAARLAGAPPPPVRVYAVRRVLRIVPAYWVALVVIALVTGREVFGWPEALIYFGFAQGYVPEHFTGGIGQAWTLTVEVAFYVALPFIALAARRLPGPVLRGEALLLAGLVAVSVAWRAVVLATVDPSDGAYFPLLVALPAQLDVFAGGMALAVLSAAGREGSGQSAGWAVAAAAYALLAVWRPGGETLRVVLEHELQAVIAVGLLAPAVLGVGGPVRRVLAWRPLAWVGLISYGVFLWHLDVLRELDGLSTPALAVCGLAASLALGAASWYGLERYAQRLGRRAAGVPPGEPHAGRPLPTTAEAGDERAR